jgi:hypothetical protein
METHEIPTPRKGWPSPSGRIPHEPQLSLLLGSLLSHIDGYQRQFLN